MYDQISDLDRQVEILLLRLRRAAAPTKEFDALVEAEEHLRDARARLRSATEASQVQPSSVALIFFFYTTRDFGFYKLHTCTGSRGRKNQGHFSSW